MDCSVARQVAQAASTVCILQPPDWRIYITPALVFLSACIAYRAMLVARASAREKATLDLIEKVESTEHYRELNATFSRLRRGPGFAHLGDPKTDQDKADRRKVNDYLNHYEMVSVGISTGILDEKFYKAWMLGPFVRDWNAAADFVQHERWKLQEDGRWDYYPRTLCHYEAMACGWSSEGIRLDRFSGGPPADAQSGGPGSEALPESAGQKEPEK